MAGRLGGEWLCWEGFSWDERRMPVIDDSRSVTVGNEPKELNRASLMSLDGVEVREDGQVPAFGTVSDVRGMQLGCNEVTDYDALRF